MDELRLKHSYAVGKKMQEIGKEKGLLEEEIKELFVLGLNHDVGYDKRLEDIANRYDVESHVHKKCKRMIETLRNK